jgi:hypothetical protein
MTVSSGSQMHICNSHKGLGCAQQWSVLLLSAPSYVAVVLRPTLSTPSVTTTCRSGEYKHSITDADTRMSCMKLQHPPALDGLTITGHQPAPQQSA